MVHDAIVAQRMCRATILARMLLISMLAFLLVACDSSGSNSAPVRHLSENLKDVPIPLEIAGGLPPRDPLLGQGDEIEIQVYRQDELTRKILIPPSEVIAYPLVGEINVHGMTSRDLRWKLTRGLEPFVKDPQVTIRTVEMRNLSYMVLGEVGHPGEYATPAATTALQAIVRAGDFTRDARHQVVLIRPKGPQQAEAFVLDMSKALKNGDLRANLTLAAGDILYVPPSDAANLDRFVDHISRWLGPVIGVESAIILGDDITHRFEGGTSTTGVVIGTK